VLLGDNVVPYSLPANGGRRQPVAPRYGEDSHQANGAVDWLQRKNATPQGKSAVFPEGDPANTAKWQHRSTQTMRRRKSRV